MVRRGASTNPKNRFDKIAYVPDEPEPLPSTRFLRDHSKSIIATNDSPDVGFSASINPYRGCEHGCSYCYARPTHEFLGFSAGLDFESKILVKEDAPELLRRELESPDWQPQVLAISGVTDGYQPIERNLELTRRCLKVLAEFRNPVCIVTKNALVARDVDILAAMARFDCAAVFVSITTRDESLRIELEPRTSTIALRLKAIRTLSAAGVPCGVLVAPVIPGLNDHEIPQILKAAAAAGARYVGYALLRLPFAVAPLFEQWLAQHRPSAKEKVLHRIRETRGGRINDPRFGSRMRGEGVYARQIARLFEVAARRAGLLECSPPLSTAHFRRSQLTLF